MAQFIGIAGAKGGVGKTVSVLNLACALANFGREVIAVDADFAKPNLGIALGYAQTPKSVHTALAGEHKLSEAVFRHPSGVNVVPCNISLDYLKHSRHHATFKDLVLELNNFAEIILIDLPSGLHPDSVETMKSVKDIIVVTTPDVPALTDCLKTIRIAREHSLRVLGAVVTKIKENNDEVSLSHIETVLGVPIIGSIPYDTQLVEALHHKYPVVYTHQHSKAALAYKKLAANLMGQTFEHDLDAKDNVWTYVLRRIGLSK